MNKHYVTVAAILIDIEKELRELRLWDSEMISEEALASEEPFAVDTMTFPQWLQFIFLPRMYFIIEQQAPLPASCSISPMAEHYFAGLNLHAATLIAHLNRIDATLNSNNFN